MPATATLTAPPPAEAIAPQVPTIQCTICFHNEMRINTATHVYLGYNKNRVYCCTACANHIRRLSISLPQEFQQFRALN